ncbi:MAG: hypothetical protein ND895_09380 [Pyrinomonadaceae bacterium]|nr:hypothetical protein [Pyrinomonadaceae bacterium]
MTISSGTARQPTKKAEEIKVFISHRDSKCGECGEQLGKQAWITLEEEKGALQVRSRVDEILRAWRRE